jgi:cobyrinic acid a,c-diamide synthase
MTARWAPIVLVAAPASGQGKTMVASALARLHSRAGRQVRVFKCGPDFLDPFWLALASGGPVHSLDLWMNGEADCAARIKNAAAESDLVIVEGVMGLFDGQPSAGDLARRFGLPVLAVIDSAAMAGTFGALAHGLQYFQPGLPWLGVLANRVGSERHAHMLRDSLRDPATWLGALPLGADWALPERHLGLVQADEVPDALTRLDAAANALANTVIGQRALVDWPAWQPPDAWPAAPEPVPKLLAGRRLAVARDAAFCFIYPGNLDCLHALGAELVYFSPLADRAVPDCDALWLPGGYPELHGPALAGNGAMRQSLQAHVAAGRPLWAECGGMMALFDSVVNRDGEAHAGFGLLPGRVLMQKRLVALGPQHWAPVAGGAMLRGHTFHHSRCETTLPPVGHSVRPGLSPHGAEGEAVYALGSVRAGYFHAWFASAPEAAAALFMPQSSA